ncbi:MAG: hypothetical protein ACC682_11640 [Gemmatimonadota bacterium]
MITTKHAFYFLSAVLLVGCGSEGGGGALGPKPVTPPNLLGNPVAGEQAFLANCAQCHASRDGFDLAAFDFSSFDIVRRGLAHVDSATSRDIAAHIDRLQTAPMRRFVAPFQPAGEIRGDRPAYITSSVDDDREFWIEVFGTSGWPADMTASALRAIDPRDYSVPLAMPLWSLEGSDEDWMPDVPLPPEVLDADGAAVRSAVSDYYAAPSEARLIGAVEAFGVATRGAGRICWRADPVPCFEARRWMASLGAQHYLRLGPDVRVPARVARVWWDVGESAIALQAISTSREERDTAFRIGARWMYVAYSYAPEAFREPAGYMGTFLSDQRLFRISLFVALRRMVGDGIAHRQHPDQFIEDARLAVRRSDAEVGLGVTEFVFQHMADRLGSGLPANLDLAAARQLVDETWDSARRFSFQDRARWDRIRPLHDRVQQLLR